MATRIILLEKLPKLGKLGGEVTVKAGYFRNYLLPKGKALLATPEDSKKFSEKREEFETAMAEKLAAAKARAEALTQVVVTLAAKAADESKLYGSLGVREIAKAIAAAAGVTLEKSEIQLSNGPLRTLGEHEIVLHLHAEVSIPLTVNVVAEAN